MEKYQVYVELLRYDWNHAVKALLKIFNRCMEIDTKTGRWSVTFRYIKAKEWMSNYREISLLNT